MFTFQTMAKKRGRDSDSDSDDGYGRDLKKSRPWTNEHISYGPKRYPSPSHLPHQSSLTPSPPRILTDIEAMTPAQSEYGWANSPDSITGGADLQSSQSNTMDYNMDMEEDDVDIRSQPPESPAFGASGNSFMRPAMLKPSLFGSESANSGRIPTPIHPTFKRRGMHGLGYPTGGSAGGLHMSNSSLGGPMPSMQAPPPRKGNRQDMEDDRSRRMPSPISEDDDMPDTPTALTQSQLSRLSFSHANADQTEMETSTTILALPPPTPRGRKRSGALTGSGRFSMGFREDCEKCRQRVPGHYSHFLP